MKRYALFDKKRGFFVCLRPDGTDRYSRDINKAAVFDDALSVQWCGASDRIVEVKVDIRLA